MSRRITVTLPDEFAPLYDQFVGANPRASSSEVMQEALIALARSKTDGKAKQKSKGKGKHKGKHRHSPFGKLPEVQVSRQNRPRPRSTPEPRPVEHPGPEMRESPRDWLHVHVA